ncbi:MAG: SMP-30/gluconolactonase/LRE family protein [Rhodothermales bacterium]
MKTTRLLVLLSFVLAAGCQPTMQDMPEAAQAQALPPKTVGSIERADPRIDALIPVGAEVEVLEEGFDWSEGPVWVPSMNAVLFSDIPRNTIHSWSESDGLGVFLRPAGYNRDNPQGKELGTNGLFLDASGNLLASNHGFRGITRLNQDNYTWTVLVDRYQGKRLNSPNDLVLRGNGDIYFTDPSYGLEGWEKSPDRELDFNGVYHLTPAGKLTLLTKEFKNPNGIGLSPDQSILYVAQSNGQEPVIRAYDIQADGSIANGRVFFDATELNAQTGRRGGFDGFVVDAAGNIFTSGPGGVLVLTPAGEYLGTILTGQATANATFGGANGSELFITADMLLLRVRTSTKGIGF